MVVGRSARDWQAAMNINDQDAIELEPQEVMPFVTWLAARHLRNTEWLCWEDIPNLSESSFELLSDAVEDAAGVLDNISGWVDSAYLHEQATADFVRRETQESAPGRQT